MRFGDGSTPVKTLIQNQNELNFQGDMGDEMEGPVTESDEDFDDDIEVPMAKNEI